jgi:hypothetical protein
VDLCSAAGLGLTLQRAIHAPDDADVFSADMQHFNGLLGGVTAFRSVHFVKC